VIPKTQDHFIIISGFEQLCRQQSKRLLCTCDTDIQAAALGSCISTYRDCCIISTNQKCITTNVLAISIFQNNTSQSALFKRPIANFRTSTGWKFSSILRTLQYTWKPCGFEFLGWILILSVKPGTQFTKYLTIYHMIILRWTYDIDLQCDKIHALKIS